MGDRVGSAWYEVDAKTTGLNRTMDAADRRIQDSGAKAERSLVGRLTGGLGRVGGVVNDIAKHAALIGVAGGAALGGIGALAIRSASQMETFNVQWEVLLGSQKAAKDRMAELTEFAATTPFEIPEVVEASRTLQVFGGTALATGDNLRLVGDVAAGTGQPFADTAMWFGRLYDAMKSGQPFGEAAMRLQEMGALSGDGRRELEKLAGQVNDGSITMDKAWSKSSDIFGQFGGLMDKQSQTMAGQWSNLMDNIGQALAGVGEILLPFAKDMVAGFNDALPVIKEVLINVFKVAGPIIGAVAGAIADLVGAIVGLFTGKTNVEALTGPFGVIGEVLVNVVSHVVEAWPQISEVIGAVMAVVGNVIGTVAPLVSQALGWWYEHVVPLLLEGFSAIAGWVQENWPMIARVIGNAAAIVGEVIQALWPVIEPIARTLLPILGDAFLSIVAVLDVITGAVRAVLDFMQSDFSPQMAAVADAFGTVWGFVAGFFVDLWNGLLQVVGSVVGTMIGIIKNVVGVAASIPGPWQEGAKQQKAALEDMEAAARNWGHETTTTLDTSYSRQKAAAREGAIGVAQAYADAFAGQGDYFAERVGYFQSQGSRLLEHGSPPKEGPLHHIDKDAEYTARLYADVWEAQGAYLRDAVGNYLGAAAGMVMGPGMAMAPAAQPLIGSLTMAPNFSSLAVPSPGEKRRIVQMLIPELIRELQEQHVGRR